jgi:hypothetical protein
MVFSLAAQVFTDSIGARSGCSGCRRGRRSHDTIINDLLDNPNAISPVSGLQWRLRGLRVGGADLDGAAIAQGGHDADLDPLATPVRRVSQDLVAEHLESLRREMGIAKLDLRAWDLPPDGIVEPSRLSPIHHEVALFGLDLDSCV